MADNNVKVTNMAYGFDVAGVSQYLEDIKSGYLQEAHKALLATDPVKNKCDQLWEGKAKENFKKNFDKDAQHVAAQMVALYIALVGEINSIAQAMAEHDRDLIEVK